jgi:hypothetical protein
MKPVRVAGLIIRMGELLTICNTVVPMMKAIDPNILVGGMSITQPWWTIDEPVNHS